jgi:hypothetical protein
MGEPVTTLASAFIKPTPWAVRVARLKGGVVVPALEPLGPRLSAHPVSRLLVLPRHSFTGNGKTDTATTVWAIHSERPSSETHFPSPLIYPSTCYYLLLLLQVIPTRGDPLRWPGGQFCEFLTAPAAPDAKAEEWR